MERHWGANCDDATLSTCCDSRWIVKGMRVVAEQPGRVVILEIERRSEVERIIALVCSVRRLCPGLGSGT